MGQGRRTLNDRTPAPAPTAGLQAVTCHLDGLTMASLEPLSTDYHASLMEHAQA